MSQTQDQIPFLSSLNENKGIAVYLKTKILQYITVDQCSFSLQKMQKQLSKCQRNYDLYDCYFYFKLSMTLVTFPLLLSATKYKNLKSGIKYFFKGTAADSRQKEGAHFLPLDSMFAFTRNSFVPNFIMCPCFRLINCRLCQPCSFLFSIIVFSQKEQMNLEKLRLHGGQY